MLKERVLDFFLIDFGMSNFVSWISLLCCGNSSITWLGNSGKSRDGGFLIGLVDPRRAGILAALVTGGCSEGRFPGVVVSAFRFFAYNKHSMKVSKRLIKATLITDLHLDHKHRCY